jgi:xanthine dehydrogenase accessory factor
MEELKLWSFVLQKLRNGIDIALMLVPCSIGSSPGRQGHCMAVADDDDINGSIGGGAMEFMMVEACRKSLKKKHRPVVYKRLVHHNSDKSLWSGLSCSGEQSVLTFFLDSKDIPLTESVVNALKANIKMLLSCSSSGSLISSEADSDCPEYNYSFINEEDWEYQFIAGCRDKVYIIGAGHVGLALCRQLFFLNFEVVLIDNRKDLPTDDYQSFISDKIITNYKKVATFVESTDKDYIVIMSFSSALDTLILSQLIDKPSRYIGMMASETKAERVRKILLKKGFSEEQFNRVHTPIGLALNCKSPAEIAVSVAAQIIQVRHNMI